MCLLLYPVFTSDKTYFIGNCADWKRASRIQRQAHIHNNKVNICFTHSAIAIKQLTAASKPCCFSPKCKAGIPTKFLSITVWGYPDRTQSERPHSSKLTWFTSQTGLETNYHCTQQIATRRERQIDRLRRSNIHKVTRRNFCNCISELEFASDQTVRLKVDKRQQEVGGKKAGNCKAKGFLPMNSAFMRV